ncbi:hypothetical protein [Heyndrickxia camelliae]|uniref:Uncharacterized protein n=1 Tax=Heyndrickxia camelliae TaxID=1707093 RepID=A0A2N3LG34_9BACI|nr:hypothetical protein [Heyndrickxia camelliae]PKR83517.1 hypothetical protein CWO92_18295 [Heyndrickxia camelliae]
MKTIKEFEYNGYQVVIKANFSWNGWHAVNCVDFTTFILKDEKVLKEYVDSAYEDKPYRILFWTVKPKRNLRELAEIVLNDSINYAKKWINRRSYESKMTNGLLESLDSL